MIVSFVIIAYSSPWLGCETHEDCFTDPESNSESELNIEGHEERSESDSKSDILQTVINTEKIGLR